MLSDPAARFHDLGSDYYESRINRERRARNLAAALEAALGAGQAMVAVPVAALGWPVRPGSDGEDRSGLVLRHEVARSE